MIPEDKERLRQAFIAAAHSPVTQTPLEGSTLKMCDILLQQTATNNQFNALEKEIDAGRITVDGIIEQLQKNYPAAVPSA